MSTPWKAGDPNLEIVRLIARKLGDLCEDMVLVGGCATGLLITAVRAQPIRMTEDVDLVAQVTTAQDYHAIEKRLTERGFTNDMRPDAPICRWVMNNVTLDVMPSHPGILSFHNHWYPLAIETAQTLDLEPGLTIRLIAAPVFIATKLEAFKGRGNNDFLLSHDLEDIVTVVDGRESLMVEIQVAPEALRQYLCEEFTTLTAQPDFMNALSGHLPGDSRSQQRLPHLIERLRTLAQSQ